MLNGKKTLIKISMPNLLFFHFDVDLYTRKKQSNWMKKDELNKYTIEQILCSNKVITSKKRLKPKKESNKNISSSSTRNVIS